REILSQQAVGVLVAAALPRTAWIAEIDLHVGGDGEVLVVSHLLASIPGQGAAPGTARSSASAGRSRMEAASTICPSPLLVVPPLAWRICRVVRRCAISAFFSTPRVWIKRLR